MTSRITIIDYSVIGIVVVAIVSLLWTQRIDTAITELRQFIIEPAIFYLMLRSCRPTKQLFLRLVDTLIIAGIVGCHHWISALYPRRSNHNSRSRRKAISECLWVA